MTAENTIPTLERQLLEINSDPNTDKLTQKIDLLNELAWKLFDIDNPRARELSETAYTLAEVPINGDPAYQAGQAYSLRTQGHLNMRAGEYSTGLAQLLKALQIFEALHFEDGLADVYNGMASSYFYMGDYPQALDMTYRQLAAAQSIGDYHRIADANHTLASIYFAMGDDERGMDLLQRTLTLVLETKHGRMECAIYIKSSQAYLGIGEDQLALENGLRGLELSRELGYQLLEVRALRRLALYYLRIHDKVRTFSHLEQALNLSRKLGIKVYEALVLMTMGEAYRDFHQYDRAKEVLNQAVTLAQSISLNLDLSRCYLLLSELYEQEGEATLALQHFKQYYDIKMLIAGEKSDQRVKLLEVLHDVETIKKETEIARLRTVELQHEISEKEKAQQQVQRQLNYAQALSACSQTLMTHTETEADYPDLLAQALQHLLEPTQASSIYLLENIEDPKMGFSARVYCRTYASDRLAEAGDQASLSTYRETILQLENKNLSDPFDAQIDVIPWSLFSADVPRQLANGVPVSQSIKELHEANPRWGEFLSDEVQILSYQFFPVLINGRWWGTLSLDDRREKRQWDAEELIMLNAATEIVKSSLQRRQAQVQLHALNKQLEQKVEANTTELRNTVKKLSKEVGQRQRAENSLQDMMDSLEQRLIARTNELATFFDLILMAGQGVDLSEIFEYVIPRIMEFTGSQSVVIDLLEEDGDAMNMIAQGNLPEEAPARVYVSKFPPELRRWMEAPNEPLLAADLAKDIPTFTKAFNLPDLLFQTYLGAQIRVGDRINGILSCVRTEKGGYGVDVIALVTTVAQQLGLILEIDRLRQQGRQIAVSEERKRLARELHDSVTQQLYSLNLFARAGRDAAADGDLAEVRLRLSQVEDNAVNVLREMRLLLYQLRPLALEGHTLSDAFEERFTLVERRLGINATVQKDFMPVLAREVEEELFYIISEALNNVLKHAQATEVRLRFASDDGRLLVSVEDNGRGFDLGQPTSGLGLEHICLRTDKIGGLVKLETTPGQGTILRLWL